MKKMDKVIMHLLVLFNIFVIAEMNKVMASFSSEFAQEWEKNYGGSYFDVGGCIFKTKDNGYIISGITETTYNSWDAWILKINDEGVMEWSNTFGGDGNDIYYVDDELKYINEKPYYWQWDERIFFRHIIKVKAYDNAGNFATDEIELRIFNLNIGGG